MDRVLRELRYCQAVIFELSRDGLIGSNETKDVIQAIQEIKNNRWEYLYGENGIPV